MSRRDDPPVVSGTVRGVWLFLLAFWFSATGCAALKYLIS